MTRLCASVIIRNELARLAAPFFEHLLAFVDEIRVLDDASTDGWEEALRPGWGREGRRVLVLRHGARATDEPDFYRHAEARNQLLRFTLKSDATHVLAIDADEFVSDGAVVRAACETRADVLTLEMAEVWEACPDLLCIREDGGWRPHEIGNLWRVAAFRSRALALRDLGHATGRVPDAVYGVPSRPTGTGVLHFGWARLAERAERYERYAVGDAGMFHAAAHIRSIMFPPSEVECRARPWPAALEPWREDLLRRVNA